MFNGIVEALGEVTTVNATAGKEFIVAASFSKDLTIGESVAVNGVCTTITTRTKDSFTFYASEQTLAITNLEELSTGVKVNLERSLAYGSRISGHTVYGHVDGMFKVTDIEVTPESWIITFPITAQEREFMIPKGSIALNGTSLTIYDLGNDYFKVMIIPHTYTCTNIRYLNINDRVNYEFDPMAKFIKQHIDSYLSNLNLKTIVKR